MSKLHQTSRGSIAVLAGRRIDSAAQKIERFPLRMMATVQERIEKQLIANRIELLVCSAACGADILAIEAAHRNGIPFKIILPYDPVLFRTSSVIDRPGNWGHLYDALVDEASRENNLINLNLNDEPALAFSKTNSAIFDVAIALKSKSDCIAIVVWDGVPRGQSDSSAEFLRIAKSRCEKVLEVSTL